MGSREKSFLPPQYGQDIVDYFASPQGMKRFPDYDSCAERFIECLDIAVASGEPRLGEAVCLALKPGFSGAAYQIEGEVPDGSRALLELAYSLTDAEIVGSVQKSYGTITFLHGLYEGTPIAFMEVYGDLDGAPIMEWLIRADRLAPEMQEPIVKQNLRPTRGEQRELIDITVDEIRILPSMTRKRWRKLKARQAESFSQSQLTPQA